MSDPPATASSPIAVRWAILLLGTIAAYLTLFAVRFADERLYMDSGYYLARVINEGAFRIEHGRGVLAFAQLLPLIGVKLGLGLKTLILLHSLNNVIWMCGCMALAWHALGDRYAALTIALLHLIGLTHGLLCPVFELYYGADLIVLFMALLRANGSPHRWRLPILVVIGALAASCHAVGFLLLSGLLVLEWSRITKREAMLLIGMLTLVATMRALTVSPYEKDSAAFLLKALDMRVLAAAVGLENLMSLLRYGLRHYPDVLALAVVPVIALLHARRRGHTVIFLLFLLLMHLLISLKLPGHLHDRYREQVNFGAVAWVVLVLMLRTPLPERLRGALPVLLLLAIVFRIVQAETIAAYYTERKQYIERRITTAHESGLSKGIIAAPTFFGPEHHVIELGWSVPVESLMLSSMPGPQGTVTLITTDDVKEGGLSGHLDAFWFRRWDRLPSAWLDTRWFARPTGSYTFLPGERAP